MKEVTYPKINIVGRGNVATHLLNAFIPVADVRIVNPHTPDKIDKDAQFIIISVTDSAISDVISKLPSVNAVAAHTSGSTPMSVFEGHDIRNFGVFYPLQTFSKNVELTYKEIPFFIEGNNEFTTQYLLSRANEISDKVYEADSEKRKKLHLASVFACNFVNHLWTISDKLLLENGLSFDMLLPLIKETTRKLSRVTPFESQTGPAVRNDRNILELQKEELKNDPDLLEIYEMISRSIIKTHIKG